MNIIIRTSIKEFILDFDNKEKLLEFYDEIKVLLMDPTNTTCVKYQQGEFIQLFPAMLIKNSVIEIKDLVVEPAFFTW